MMMLGLRKKLALGLSGPILILIGTGILSSLLLTTYSATLERLFRENYDSITYGQTMKGAIDDLDTIAQRHLWSTDKKISREHISTLLQKFEDSRSKEAANITLPEEDKAATELTQIWQTYRKDYEDFLAEEGTPGQQQKIYELKLEPQAQDISRMTQQIIDLNLANIVSVDGQVRASAKLARRTMTILVSVGILSGLLFTFLIGRSLLRPLATLTQSVREIERGNLDLVVAIPSKDELGQLAEAFNSMAAKLREYRRSDRAKMYRLQRTTQLALNTFPDAVLIVGLDGKVELANETAKQQFELEPGLDLSVAANKVLWKIFEQVFTTMAPVHPKAYASALQVFTDGKEHFYLPQAVPIMSEDKNLLGVTVVLSDVTELRRLDEMKSNLVSVVSHELKTPLTSIRMATHLLLEERVGPLTPKQSELLTTARDDAERLNEIIERLLDMGRIESGRALMDLKPIAVEKLLIETIDRFATSYRDRGVKLTNHIESDLPAVMADLSRIGHVFSNLLDNSLKYTPSGGEVSITAKAEGDVVAFTVQDTGRGIPQDALPKIFERFFRVSNQDEVKGAGLGLAIAREIIDAHGGKMTVTSQLGVGSAFTFTLKQSTQDG